MGQEEEGEGRTVAGPIEWRRTAALIQRTLRVRAKLQAESTGSIWQMLRVWEKDAFFSGVCCAILSSDLRVL